MDKVKCYKCNNVFIRGQTLILETPKGRFRLCRDCFNAYEAGKLDEDYQDAKDNVSLFGIKTTDAYEMIKKKEEFIKNIKEGRI